MQEAIERRRGGTKTLAARRQRNPRTRMSTKGYGMNRSKTSDRCPIVRSSIDTSDLAGSMSVAAGSLVSISDSVSLNLPCMFLKQAKAIGAAMMQADKSLDLYYTVDEGVTEFVVLRFRKAINRGLEENMDEATAGKRPVAYACGTDD